MYPFVRLFIEISSARRAPRMHLLDTHVSQHRCWPWDLDPWRELNNGRTLTLFDLGRLPASIRIGMVDALRAGGWGMTVAGSSVRYRQRVRMMQRFETRTRLIGWDARFLYIEQSMWRRGQALNHMLVRMAVTSPNGIVAPQALIARMGPEIESPALPDWVTAWIAAESLRPWPPMGPDPVV